MLNLDFKQRVMIDTDSMDWVASPASGVWRKPLAREEAERGHATSVVIAQLPVHEGSNLVKSWQH